RRKSYSFPGHGLTPPIVPINSPVVDLGLLRSERSDNLLEAWIAAQRVPPRKQFQPSIAGCSGQLQSLVECVTGKLLFTRPRRDDREILDHAGSVVGLLCDGEKFNGAAPLT